MDGRDPIILEDEHRENIRFPVYRKEAGRNYAGLEKTLNKPHGLKPLMDFFIKELMKGPKKFQPLMNKLSKKYPRNDINDVLEILKVDGIIEIISKNKRPKVGHYWVPMTVRLDLRAKEELIPEETMDVDQKINILRGEVSEVLGDTTHPLGKHILDCLEKGPLTDSKGEIAVEPKAWYKYRSVILTLAHSIKLQKEVRVEPLRVVSERIWGKSKILDRYKGDITRVAGTSLTRLNLTLMPELTFLYGNFTWVVNGQACKGTTGLPVVLAEETIKNLDITGVNAKQLLIIENYAVFIELLNRKYFQLPDTILLWGEGYFSSIKRHLMGKILLFRPLPVYIWSDLDSEGLNLTYDIIKFLKDLGVQGKPLLMTSKELAFTSGHYSGAKRLKLDDEELNKIFSDVIPLIKNDITMEQEELLIHYDIIEKYLPI